MTVILLSRCLAIDASRLAASRGTRWFTRRMSNATALGQPKPSQIETYTTAFGSNLLNFTYSFLCLFGSKTSTIVNSYAFLKFHTEIR
jgi:hypothetical protein